MSKSKLLTGTFIVLVFLISQTQVTLAQVKNVRPSPLPDPNRRYIINQPPSATQPALPSLNSPTAAGEANRTRQMALVKIKARLQLVLHRFQAAVDRLNNIVLRIESRSITLQNQESTNSALPKAQKDLANTKKLLTQIQTTINQAQQETDFDQNAPLGPQVKKQVQNLRQIKKQLIQIRTDLLKIVTSLAKNDERRPSE